VLSNQDFGVKQFFWADDFWAVDPFPLFHMWLVIKKNNLSNSIKGYQKNSIYFNNPLEEVIIFK
jgi:hypothetical protein